MKTRILPFMVVAFLIPACSENNNPQTANTDVPVSLSSLKGEIAGWHDGTFRYVSLTYLDSQAVVHTSALSSIDSFGDFFLHDLFPPAQSVAGSHISPSDSQYTEILENTFGCSDSSAKIIWGELRVGNDSTFAWVGSLSRVSLGSGQPEKTGDYVVRYCFLTKDVKLSGTIKGRINNGTDSAQVEEIYHYDLSFKNGWNQEVYSLISQNVFTDSNKTISSKEYTLTNIEPSPGKWIFAPF